MIAAAQLEIVARCPICGRSLVTDEFLLELTIKAQTARARMRLAIPTAVDGALEAVATAMRCRLRRCGEGEA